MTKPANPISGGSAVLAWVPLVAQLAPLLIELATQAPKVVKSVSSIFKAISEDERTPEEYRILLAQDDVALEEKVRQVVALANEVKPLPEFYDPNKPRSWDNKLDAPYSASSNVVNPE
jgi:hypothetical protein